MKIFITGFGNVAQGFCETLVSRGQFLRDRYGRDITVVGVMDSKTYVTDENGLDVLRLIENKKVTGKVGTNTYDDREKVLSSVDFDILVEATPTDVKTGGVGFDNMMYALEHGKDVITSNKGPLALRFKDIMDAARKNGRYVRFEGTVAAAMPMLNLCKSDLAGEKIKSIRGIFNGTCNYILSKMDNGQPFEQALKEAQQQGYAETDPTNDIDGYDCACKVVILANYIFGRNVTFNDVDVTGISGITADAIAFAKANGNVIRLIGEVSSTKLEVAPRLIPKGHPLGLSGTLNTAEISTDFAGPVTVMGRGAGRLETASAILSDLIYVLDRRLGE